MQHTMAEFYLKKQIQRIKHSITLQMGVTRTAYCLRLTIISSCEGKNHQKHRMLLKKL